MPTKSLVPWIAAAAALAALAASSSSFAAGAAPTAAGPRVALVTSVGNFEERGQSTLAALGLRRAGVQGVLVVSKKTSDYAPNLRSAIAGKATVVVAVGPGISRAVLNAAQANPKVRFVLIGVDVAKLRPKPRNVEGVVFRDEEIGYAVGYLAGLHADQTRQGTVVGSVGGLKTAGVDRYIAGFQAGVGAAAPAIDTLNNYAGSFSDPAKCADKTEDLVAAGSEVVFEIARGCGAGAITAAKAQGACVIVSGTDARAMGTQVLTSAVERTDVAVVLALRGVKSGAFRGGTSMSIGAKEKALSLGKTGCGANPAHVAQARGVLNQIGSGQITDIPTTLQ